jgi:hypothetical protein
MSTIYEIGGNNPTIRRRTEKGWTLDFVFNKDNNPWSNGSTFYYWGIQDETNVRYYADNNLSFSFTNDGRVMWEAYRYSGYCHSTSGFTESFYTSTGQTEPLCSGGTSNDFNLTITFERNSIYENCDIQNEGGWDDLITGVTVTNPTETMTGATEQVTYVEQLNEKWANSQNKRLGTLIIYLNGQRIYKIKNWEEVIPSKRGSDNSIVQIWGGGTTGSNDLHLGDTAFLLNNVEYFEEPLSFLQIKNNYNNNIKPNFSIVECNQPCNPTSLIGYFIDSLLFEDGDKIITESENNIIRY